MDVKTKKIMRKYPKSINWKSEGEIKIELYGGKNS
jgi:hypothetical protein